VQFVKIMGRQATVISSLRSQFRHEVLTVWLLACVVLGRGRLTGQRLFARVFFGIFSIFGAWLPHISIEEESVLVSNGTLRYRDRVSRPPRRGRWIGPKCEYQFVALDGRHYEASSGGKARQRITLLYNPLLPRKNKPLAAFTFYQLQSEASW